MISPCEYRHLPREKCGVQGRSRKYTGRGAFVSGEQGPLAECIPKANTGDDATRFAASCCELQASRLCSPESLCELGAKGAQIHSELRGVEIFAQTHVFAERIQLLVEFERRTGVCVYCIG